MIYQLQNAALTVLLALSATPRAQQDPSEPTGQPSPTVSIEFAGGTLEQFIDKIRQADGNVNIVASEMASGITLPALTLREATVESALRAVGNIVPPDFNVDVKTERGKTGLPVHVVLVRSRPRSVGGGLPGMASDEPSFVRVFSIRTITEALPNTPRDLVMDAKTVLTAIDTGLDIGSKPPSATIRYHKESGLLFVRGTATQISVIDEALQSIARDLDRLRSAASEVAHPEPKYRATEEKGGATEKKDVR